MKITESVSVAAPWRESAAVAVSTSTLSQPQVCTQLWAKVCCIFEANKKKHIFVLSFKFICVSLFRIRFLGLCFWNGAWDNPLNLWGSPWSVRNSVYVDCGPQVESSFFCDSETSCPQAYWKRFSLRPLNVCCLLDVSPCFGGTYCFHPQV